jgi:FkbM family methyltransferase
MFGLRSNLKVDLNKSCKKYFEKKQEFRDLLTKRLEQNWANSYGADNHDPHRFGPYNKVHRKRTIKDIVKLILGYTPNVSGYKPLSRLLNKYGEGLQHLFDHLETDDKNLLMDLIAYRIAGASKIKLPLNTKAYWNLFDRLKECTTESDVLDPGFLHFKLYRSNLKSFGYPVDLYDTPSGIVTQFFVEQYAYKTNDRTLVSAEEGDVVLDLGGCWGDTALYFATKVGENGKVYSFEFIPKNIHFHNINSNLNVNLKSTISVVPFPVSDVSDTPIFYQDRGPASKISLQPFDGQTGETKTLSIDDFVTRYNVEKVDLIKMDIEGAEPHALKGAEKTIRKFKPKLAVSIYHSLDDMVNIPRWILDLGLGYKLYLGHYKIHSEETVLFAKTR